MIGAVERSWPFSFDFVEITDEDSDQNEKDQTMFNDQRLIGKNIKRYQPILFLGPPALLPLEP